MLSIYEGWLMLRKRAYGERGKIDEQTSNVKHTPTVGRENTKR